MSWLTDLAGKAETLLNKIDQNAAVVLKDKSLISDQLTDVIWNGTSPPRRGSLPSPDNVPTTSAALTSGSVLIPHLPRTGPSGAPSPASRLSPARLDVNAKRNDDEDILRFLNSSDRMTPGLEDIRRSPSGASIPSRGSCSPINLIEGSSLTHSRSHSRNPSQGTASVGSVFDEPIIQHCFKPVQPVGTNNEANVDTTLSSVMEENNLLKNEIRSLNNEVSLLLHRSKAAEREVRVTAEELQHLREQKTHYDKMHAELNTLQEQLSGTQEKLDTVLTENRRLNKSKNQQQQNERSASDLAFAMNSLEQVKAERDSYIEENRELALQLSHLQKEAKEGATQNERHWQQLATLRSEAEQYRARATRVLQEKENLIASMRAGELVDGEGPASALEQELVQLREEQELLRRENVSQAEKLQAARQELQELESGHEDSRQRMDAEIQRLHERLQEERNRRISAEEDYRSHCEELRVVQHELSQQRDLLASRLREAEADILRLQQRASHHQPSSNTSTNNGELESRVRHLATTLVQKQGALEALIAERNALRLQLEHSEKQISGKESQPLISNGSAVLSLNENDNAMRLRVPTLLTESPTDTLVTRRVKRAYSTLDTLSIRVGVFLRRYPLARILVILYMVILHLWVALVLFTHSPEAHSLTQTIMVPAEPNGK